MINIDTIMVRIFRQLRIKWCYMEYWTLEAIFYTVHI